MSRHTLRLWLGYTRLSLFDDRKSLVVILHVDGAEPYSSDTPCMATGAALARLVNDSDDQRPTWTDRSRPTNSVLLHYYEAY